MHLLASFLAGVSHHSHRPSAAHSPDDMGTRKLRQLPVFSYCFPFLNSRGEIPFMRVKNLVKAAWSEK